MTKPVRLQLSRRAGFNLQALSHAMNGLPAFNVARPGRFGNPFTMTGCREAGYRGTDEQIAARCAEAYRPWLGPYWQNNWQGPESERKRSAVLDGLSGLRGKNLACWCKPGAPCHADVLIELANRLACEEVDATANTVRRD